MSRILLVANPKSGVRSNKNILDFSFGSEKKVWWIDDEGYEWKTSCLSRVSRNRKSSPLLKPSRANKDYHSIVRVTEKNQLSRHYPKLVKEWHPKNERGPETYTIKSGISVFWLCEKGHEWKAPISHRTNGTNCPYCSKSSTSNSSKLTFPSNDFLLTKDGYTNCMTLDLTILVRPNNFILKPSSSAYLRSVY